MRAVTAATPSEFLVAAAAVLAAHPAVTNVITTVATAAAAADPDEQNRWWLVSDGDEVVGAAMHTPPFPMTCSPMPTAAAQALGEALLASGSVPGIVSGRQDVVADVRRALGAAVGTAPVMAETLYRLGVLTPADGVPGVPRAVTAAEIDLLERWHREFVAEAGLPAAPERAVLLARIADGAAWWWVHDGQRVSLAGHAPVVPAGRSVVGRIGPVYTPVPFRRRGFGAAVTAHVATLLQQRCTDVVLFADDANPTSNGVYRRLGFEPAAQWVEVPTR